MGQQILGSDKILRINDFSLLGLVQSFDWNPAFNTQDVFELGRDTKVASAQELETNGTFEVTSMGATPSVLARMIVRRSGDAFTGYAYSGTPSGGMNAYSFTQADLRECQFDLICHERSNQDEYDRATVLPRVFLTSIAGRAEAGGNASETFNFGGDFVMGMPSPYHDVRAIPATRTTSNTATMADTAMTDYSLVYFYIDERRLRTVAGDGVYATMSALGVVTITGMTIPTNAVMRAIVYKSTSPSTTFPVLADADRPSPEFFIRGYMASIFIAPANDTSPTANEQWLKVQNVDWNIDLRVEALRQIAYSAAGTSIYCRLPTYPLNITINASSYESDWMDWKAILDPTVKPFGGTGTDVYGETYDLSIVSLKTSFAVVIQYFTKNGTKLQEWRFKDCVTDGRGTRVVVQGRAEVNWSLRATQFDLIGYEV